jgi:acyl-CoA synthetase (NDP forming)
MEGPVTQTPAAGIDFSGLFTPRSIAVVGSASAGKHASMVVRNLVAWKYPGEVYPINREGADIEGYRGYPTLADLPSAPDCAMLVVPAANCTELVQECADAGVRFAVIGASGFAELQTPAGIERQRAIEAIARSSGLRLVGPNTNGIFNASDRVSLGYNVAHGEPFAAGDVSIVSHSGALFDGLARRLNAIGTGLSKFVPVGNEADLTMLDFVEFLIGDPATRVIGLVVEGLGDGPRFRRLAAHAAAAGKPIVALKIGRSDIGAGATLAHSSRLAGATRAYDALLRECGVASVTSVEGLAGGCGLLSLYPNVHAARDEQIVVVTTSGAGGALVADVATERGLTLAGAAGEWAEPAATALAKLGVPARIRNPVDLGTLGDWTLLGNVLRETQSQADGPVVVYAHNAPRASLGDRLAEALIARRAAVTSPVVVLTPGGLLANVEAALTAGGVPVFHDTAACFDSLMCYYALRRAVPDEARAAVHPRGSGDRDAAGLLARGGTLSELESAAILRPFGLPIVASITVTSGSAAEAAAATCGYPVVLKALAPGIAHKNALGFVDVGLATPEAVRHAYGAMESLVANAGFDRAHVPLIVQPMIAGELELIAGVSWESTLGHFLVFGFGGVHAELLDDVMLFPMPIGRSALRARIGASRAGRFLASTAGEPDTILERLIDALDALQAVVAEHGDAIASIDVNPLVVSGADLVAVDALVVTR